jgi:hypothetical protein
MRFQQPVEFQKISSATIAYRKFDSGKPVIFLHGWPLAGVIFRKMIPFRAKRFHLVCSGPAWKLGIFKIWCRLALFLGQTIDPEWANA